MSQEQNRHAAFQPFTLPNGSVLKNRIVKAAMEENLADVSNFNQPSERLIRLYNQWGKGGAGMILSGHIMIDPFAMAGPGTTLLAKDAGSFDKPLWQRWVHSAQQEGAQFWLQINHPGRQVRKGSGLPTYGPSAVSIKMGRLSTAFDEPLPMTVEHIQDVIRRFIWTAKKAEELGVSGVEIHAAHGYLMSQFLSPITNKRTDEWGGPLENRARLLFAVLKGVRAAVSPTFGVGIKINSSDFQRGGFDTEDLFWIVQRINSMGIDFVELSGGSLESPAMFGPSGSVEKSERSTAREVYFLEAAQKILKVAKMPVLITGGIARRSTLEKVIDSSDQLLAGMATALGLQPDLPNMWMSGKDIVPSLGDSWILPHHLNSLSKSASVQYNLRRLSNGSSVWQGVWPMFALIVLVLNEAIQMRKYKQWIGTLRPQQSSH